MLHGLVPKSLLPYAGTSILAPAWSLSLEWQFYLIAPALIGCLSRRPASLLLGVVSIVGLAYVSRRLVGDQYQYGSMLLLSLHFFAIGIFSRLLLDSKFGRSRTMWVAAALGAIGMLLKYPTEACVWLLWSLFAHLEVAQGSPSIGLALVSQRFLATNTVVIALGKWSYPTYLLHIPVFAAFVWAGVNGLEAQASGPALQRGVWICLVMSMMALVPLSWATHVYLEKPAMRWFMRYSSGDGQR
jgi:peptidoglycan/LPS O-acetylase OafA/YrhL